MSGLLSEAVGGVAGSAASQASAPRRVVVVGGGMVAQRFVEALRDRDDAGRHHVTVLAEEPRALLIAQELVVHIDAMREVYCT